MTTNAGAPAAPKRKPWQRRRPRLDRRDVVLMTDQQPLAELRIYKEALVYLKRDQVGTVRSHLVHPDAIAQTLSRVPVASGLLLPNTLGTGRVNGTPFYVLYIPPRVVKLKTPGHTYTIPTPPLVWAGCGNEYRIWALGEDGYPTRTDLPLWVAPFPNCYKHGGICWGDVGSRPAASPKTLLAMLTLFLEESYFNAHVANGKSVRNPTSVLALYEQLDPAEPYPLDDLMPAELQLNWLLSGGPWRKA